MLTSHRHVATNTISHIGSQQLLEPAFDIPTKRYEHKSVRAGSLRYSASSVFAPEQPHALRWVADHHNLRNQTGWKEIRYTSGCLKTLPLAAIQACVFLLDRGVSMCVIML